LARVPSVPGLTRGEIAAGIAMAIAVAGVTYRYMLLLGRIDARFRHVHPRKFHLTNVAGFYAFGGLAVALLLAGPWLVAHDRHETPAELMVYHLAVPCLLAGAAAAHRTRVRASD
jgi:hypothetical protein